MNAPPIIIGCGILEKEIRFLIKKNNWQNRTAFLPSGLHVDFARLQGALELSLRHYSGQPAVVFYGACHPRMDQILDAAGVTRTPGQNCVDICLGHETFCRELEQGAFFLFEDWALHWKEIVGAVMPGDPEIMRSIFRSAHTYLLAIRTPCSGDFSAEAESISTMTSLEIRWIDVELDHLEANLAATLDRAKEHHE
ncbi:MAG: hypothetical protein A2076_04010 [Geobacteraceae bacterium GWC2_53_11]|nr:MAG: hypothetical protein A2076_04010 [Geobacteraceae bacterium GWC2_53_11]